jgi:hypothetical protein
MHCLPALLVPPACTPCTACLHSLYHLLVLLPLTDLPAEFDIPSGGSPHTKVCGGLDAVAKACSKEGDLCGAFTFGGDKDCGYLKYRYYGDSYPGPPPLKFTGNNKGWSTYVHEGIVSKAQGGSLDCADAKNAGVTLCQIKATLPPTLSSVTA